MHKQALKICRMHCRSQWAPVKDLVRVTPSRPRTQLIAWAQVVCGGVASNQYLRQELTRLAADIGKHVAMRVRAIALVIPYVHPRTCIWTADIFQTWICTFRRQSTRGSGPCVWARNEAPHAQAVHRHPTPTPRLCTDNGVMVAWTAQELLAELGHGADVWGDSRVQGAWGAMYPCTSSGNACTQIDGR